MEIMRVYFRMYIPPSIEDESNKLWDLYQDSLQERRKEFDLADMKEWMSSHKSDEMKAWQKYSSFLGDEGELRDKDGSKLLDEDGYWIQEWSVDNEGGLLDSKGRPIYYNDGTRVRERKREDYMPYIDKWFPLK